MRKYLLAALLTGVAAAPAMAQETEPFSGARVGGTRPALLTVSETRGRAGAATLRPFLITIHWRALSGPL